MGKGEEAIEAGGDEGRDGRNNYQNLIGRAARPERHPHGETDQYIAEHSQEKQLGCR